MLLIPSHQCLLTLPLLEIMRPSMISNHLLQLLTLFYIAIPREILIVPDFLSSRRIRECNPEKTLESRICLSIPSEALPVAGFRRRYCSMHLDLLVRSLHRARWCRYVPILSLCLLSLSVLLETNVFFRRKITIRSIKQPPSTPHIILTCSQRHGPTLNFLLLPIQIWTRVLCLLDIQWFSKRCC